MSGNNKLNLLVQFTGVDKLSQNIRNIVGAAGKGSEAIDDMRRDVRLMEKDLAKVHRTLAKGGSQNGGLIMAERELSEAIARTNHEIDRQQRRLDRVASFKTKASNAGSAMGKAGAFALASITAPAAVVLNSIDNVAERALGLKNAANVAGMMYVPFQRNAYAARSVGIEYDKYGDILKDTQDKMGEFINTGGGEMKDFFEKIGPKAKVTAKDFKNLSGADALQLYHDSLVKAGLSQKEMVFYMEAIGDESSALLPLLANNGAKMKEMGANAAIISPEDAEELKRYTDAQKRLGDATLNLQLAISRAGLVDLMIWITDKGSAAAQWFGTFSPAVQKAAVVFGMIAAIAGPVLIFFGAVASAVGTLAPVFVTVGTGIGAIVGGIGTVFSALAPAISAVVGVVGAVPLLIAAAVAAVGVAAYMIYTHWDQVKSALSGGIAWLKGAFNALPGWMRSVGAMMMQGLIMALNPALLVTRLISVARTGVTAFKNYFGIKSPSRLFMEMGGHINDGLGIGLEKGQGRPVRAVGRMAGAVAGASALALSPGARATPAAQKGGDEYHLHITQQPGEDSEAFARRTVDLLRDDSEGKRRRGFEDDF